MSTKKYFGIDSLEKKYGLMTLGFFIRSVREADAISQSEYAAKLKISRANLCDIEKCRRLVSVERAARLAKAMKMPEALLVKLALQDLLREARLDYQIDLKEVA